MITFPSPAHAGHAGGSEFQGGALSPAHETPDRHETVRAALQARGLAEFRPVPDRGTAPLARVHNAGYLAFLASAWDEWVRAGRTGPALAGSWRVPGMRGRVPDHIDGRLGHYASDACCPVVAGTWEAAYGSAQSALAAADAVASGAAVAMALCRPPGHHARPASMGGYCYLNNAAIAARALRDAGAGRVAVLDVDYHHGDGTQHAFWSDGTVLTASLHADPSEEYPYFCGHADETGAGDGEGTNVNVPLPRGTGGDAWLTALDALVASVRGFGAEAVVVALGTDTYEGDPISGFRLVPSDFVRAGRSLAALGRPVVLAMEGGYAVEALGDNVANVVEGYLDG